MPLLDLTQKATVPGSLAAYTRTCLIVPELRERDTAGVISELSLVLQRGGGVPDMLPFYHTALNQELLADSALDCGLAFPHARLSGVKQLQFAFGRTRKPIMWGAKSIWPVQLVFLLAVPATDAASYLHLLASIATLGRQRDYLKGLHAAKTPEKILAVLRKIQIRQG